MFEVCLVDDDADLRKSLSQSMELEGFAVSRHDHARIALADMTENFAGVVLTDIKMPGMSGVELLQEIMAIDGDIPVVLMSGHGDISTAVEAMRLGAYDFLEKPFRTRHLIDILYRAIEKRRLVLENRELRSALKHQGEAGSLADDLGLSSTQGLPAVDDLSLVERVERYEKLLIEAALTRHRGNVKQTYTELKLPRKTLYDKFARYGIDQGRYR